MGETTVVTRFAPSPTGFLHIGSARTALFSWLYARHCGGQFRLRIEDTDRERSTDEAIQAILTGMRWLGLDWDEEVVYQSARAARHAEVAQALLEAGQAYRCYATPEDLENLRAAARETNTPLRFAWRDRDPAEAPDGAPFVVRLKAPQAGSTIIEDVVQGPVEIANEQLDDMVLLRSDGTPTYMLAVVVDDHDMGVTHVLRGDDHLINAARQRHILEAMGWPVPTYGHVPLIHGPDGKKLSKRHGALGVEGYRDMGYLPETMRNYLARLGWAHGDDEIFSTEEAIGWFDLTGLKKSPAQLDFDKLNHVNSHYLKTGDPDALFPLIESRLTEAAGKTLDLGEKERVMRAWPALADRAKTIHDLGDGARFLVAARPIPIEPASAKHLTADARTMLVRLAAALGALDSWDGETIEAGLRTFAEAEGLKFGQVAQPLRAAVTGTPQSPGLSDVLVALGRDETLARINDQTE